MAATSAAFGHAETESGPCILQELTEASWGVYHRADIPHHPPAQEPVAQGKVMPTPPPAAWSWSLASAGGMAPSSLVRPRKATQTPSASKGHISGLACQDSMESLVEIVRLCLDLIFGLL